MEIAEQQIHLALKEGRKDAFEMIFKSLYRPLCTYAHTLLSDRDEAEEVVQNAFVGIWEKRNEIEVTHSLKSYMYRSVRNASLNVIKHRKVRVMHQNETAKTADFARTDEGQYTGELERRIAIAMKALPEQCRLVFSMSRFEELRYQEIADQLGISIKTVENHIGKALRIMREQLSDYLPALAWLLLLNYLN